MNNLVVRIGAALYPLLTAFALTGAIGCGSVESGDDGVGPGMDDPGSDDPGADDAGTPAMPVAGALDPAFGADGILELPIGHGYAGGIAAQGDKLILCSTIIDGANARVHLQRVTQSGVIDTQFGTDGDVAIEVAGTNVGCGDLELTPDGHIVVVARSAASSLLKTFDYNGAPVSETTFPALGRTTALPNGRLATSYIATDKLVTGSLDAMGANGQWKASNIGDAASTVRGFQRSDGSLIGVGRFGTTTLSWRVMVSGPVGLLEVPAPAAAGTKTNDLLADAAMFADGSVFAVGGMDSGTEVMTARWTFGDTPAVTVDHHTGEGASMAMAVTIDAQQRAFVVGSASDGSHTRFAWQRYLPTSTALDPAYQMAGVASAVAPMGNGELVDAVMLNGSVFAIGSFATESNAPRIALLKIHQ